MSTTRTMRYHGYLICGRDGNMRVRLRRPTLDSLGPSEYAFEVVLSVPVVERKAVVGSVELALPPDVDGDARASIDASGPVEGPGADDTAVRDEEAAPAT